MFLLTSYCSWRTCSLCFAAEFAGFMQSRCIRGCGWRTRLGLEWLRVSVGSESGQGRFDVCPLRLGACCVGRCTARRQRIRPRASGLPAAAAGAAPVVRAAHGHAGHLGRKWSPGAEVSGCGGYERTRNPRRLLHSWSDTKRHECEASLKNRTSLKWNQRRQCAQMSSAVMICGRCDECHARLRSIASGRVTTVRPSPKAPSIRSHRRLQVSTCVPVRCQAFLEAPSIASRLKLGLTALRKHRKVLVALTSLKGLEDA